MKSIPSCKTSQAVHGPSDIPLPLAYLINQAKTQLAKLGDESKRGLGQLGQSCIDRDPELARILAYRYEK
jgi:hypothetical protein